MTRQDTCHLGTMCAPGLVSSIEDALACASAEGRRTRRMAEIYFFSCCGCKTHGAIEELGGSRLEPFWALLGFLQDLTGLCFLEKYRSESVPHAVNLC